MKINPFLCLSIVLLAGCASRSGQPFASTSRSLQPVALGAARTSVTLEAKDRNAYVPLKKNGTITVALNTNELMEYSWKVVSPSPKDETVVKVETPEPLLPIALPPESIPQIKSPVPQQWRFKGVGLGVTKVKMLYTRRNQPVADAVPFEFTVNVME